MPSIIRYLGELALASRLKMLSESLMMDVGRIYKEHNFNFEPRWFLTFYQLSKKSPMAITELAEAIGITHPAVNQITTELFNEGLIETKAGTEDKRKRFISLSDKGKLLLVKLIPVWDIIELANKEVIDKTSLDFLKSIERIENALAEKSMYIRINEMLNKQFEENISIIDFNSALKEHFQKLNYRWLSKYFTIEELDDEILCNPEEKIIKNGGHILFASFKKEIIGTCALIKHSPALYELSKMAVNEEFQGKQVGKRLAIAIIEKAKLLGAEEIFLITHEKLTKATNLYKGLGFQKINDFKDIKYDRGGITMKLNL